jgi:hypothetical protein
LFHKNAFFLHHNTPAKRHFHVFSKHPPAPGKGQKSARAGLLNSTLGTTHAAGAEKLSEPINIFRSAMVFLLVGV